jgi:hypothetical protein
MLKPIEDNKSEVIGHFGVHCNGHNEVQNAILCVIYILLIIEKYQLSDLGDDRKCM